MRKCILFLMMILLSSCYGNMYHFEEGDLDWVNCYALGDTIKFKTNNGTDMLYMDEKEVFDKKSPFLENESQDLFGDYNAIAYYSGYFIHNSSKHEVWLSISKNSYNGISASIQLGRRFCFGVKDSRNINQQGTSVRDTIIVDDKNSEYRSKGPVTDDFENFKWSKKNGLIEYRLRDGTIYPKPQQN